MENNERELINSYLNGNSRAFADILSLYLTPLYNFIFRLTNDNQLSEDIVQEVFIKVWKNLRKFDQKKKFKTWIFTIARNTAIDFLRKNKEIHFSEFENGEEENFIENTLSDTAPLPDEMMIKNEDADALKKALDEIPLFYKEVLLLRYMENLTFEEIGKALNKPLNTVKSQNGRALQILKEKLLRQNR